MELSKNTKISSGSNIELNINTASSLSSELIDELNLACERMENSATGLFILKLQNTGDATVGDWPMEPEAVNLRLVNRWERALRRLERLPVMTVSIAGGECNSMALEVLLASDCRLVYPDLCIRIASFSGDVWPGMALHRLTSRLGTAAAMRLTLLTSTLTADRARELGIVDQVVSPGPALDDYLKQIPCKDGAAVSLLRRLISDAACTSFEDALGGHLAACDRVARLAGSDMPAPSVAYPPIAPLPPPSTAEVGSV